MDATRAELESMGFPPHLVHQALQRSHDVETAIEWILSRLGNDPMPEPPLSHLSNLDRLDHLDRLDRLDHLHRAVHGASHHPPPPGSTHAHPSSAATSATTAAAAAGALQKPEVLASAAGVGASSGAGSSANAATSAAVAAAAATAAAAGGAAATPSSSSSAPIPIPRSSSHPLTGAVTRHPLSSDDKYEDEDVSRAIEESLRSRCDESVDPNERRRVLPTPVGLRNVGNTCYFNTLLQSYFAIPTFRAFVLSLDFSTYDPDPSVQFLHELQKLFGFMMLSDRKFVDPSMVIHTMLINSNRSIGGQEDPTEFSIIFIEAVQTGLKAYRRQQSHLPSPDATVPTDSATVTTAATTGAETTASTTTAQAPPTEPKDFIQQMFCAEQLQTVFVKRVDGTPEELVQKTEFYQVILNVSCGDLYRGLDNYTSLTEIDDYAEPNYDTRASKMVFFESFPPVLTLLLQRLDFDKTKNEAIKLNNAFTFDKHIYVDRYLHANMADTLARRERIKRKLEEMNVIREDLDRLEHYQHGPVSVCNHLRSVMQFLCERGDPDDQYAISKLGQYADDIDFQMANSRQLLANLNGDIAAAFSDAKKTVGYRLHAALVHDGTAINGHYWAFVFDAEKGLWYKHNDAHVTQVDEELVLRETTGGDSKASGYCLIYINDQLFDEASKEKAKGYELIPLELQAIIADDNAAFTDELQEWELRRTEREAAAQAEAQLRNQVELFKQEYHSHMDRLITRISEARGETEDHRLESFTHFLWEINSQDLAQTQIAESVYLQLFGERLDLVRRSRLVQMLAVEFTDVNFQPPTMGQRDELYILQVEYNKFLLTTRYLIMGLELWLQSNALEGLRHIVFAMKHDLDIRYLEARRDRELRDYLLVMLYELSESAKARLLERDWGGGLDYAFTVATLLAQKVPRNNLVYLRLRDEWEAIFAQLHQSCRTLTPTMAYHREVIIKSERMYSNLGSNPNLYSFPQPAPPPNYPAIAEHYRTIKEQAATKRLQLLEQLEAPYTVPEFPPFIEEESETDTPGDDDTTPGNSQTPTNDLDDDDEEDEEDELEDDEEDATHRSRDAYHA